MSDKARNAIAARTAAASFHFSSQQRVCLSAVPTVCRRRRDRPYSTVGGGWPGSPGGDKRGRDTKVSLPLLTPQPFLRTRLPSVARLKARGPQGRLVLQGHILDRSGAFRSRTLPLCTVWPRTVMRGSLRKVNSGHNSIPKSARRTELSPVSPVSPRDQRASRRKGGFGGSQEGAREPYGALAPFCLRRQTAAFPPVNTGPPGRRRRPMTTSSEGVKSPSALPRCIGGRFCVC